MIYYNVTSQIDINIETEWVKWMQEEHIPEMLNTKYFIEVKLLKINLDDKVYIKKVLEIVLSFFMGQFKILFF